MQAEHQIVEVRQAEMAKREQQNMRQKLEQEKLRAQDAKMKNE